MRERHADVLIVGGGFTGMIAARDLRRRGHDAIVLEAADRLGGRTWTRWSDPIGRELEIGGTWIHWLQPHVWSELTYYGIEVVLNPPVLRNGVLVDGVVAWTDADEAQTRLKEGTVALLKGVTEHFPNPYDPATWAGWESVDGASVRDRLDELELPAVTRALIEAKWVTNVHGALESAALTHALRWGAAASAEPALLFKAVGASTIVGGTRGLLQAITAEAAQRLELGTQVACIDATAHGVAVASIDGRSFTGLAAIIAIGIPAMQRITFKPVLTPKRRAFVDAGSASTGVKTWIRARGMIEPFIGMAPPPHPVSIVATQGSLDRGDTLLVAFGPDASALPPDDTRGFTAALQPWIPDLEIVAIDGHDWVTDPLYRQTWATLRPGQLVNLQAMHEPQGTVHFAGSDLARGWVGFIDGAIESGSTAALAVHRMLSSNQC